MAEDGKVDLILEELRGLRAEFNAFSLDTGERVASLEIQVKHGISGNGQPSRLQVVEDRVESLSVWRWRIVGICGGASGVIMLLGWLLRQ